MQRLAQARAILSVCHLHRYQSSALEPLVFCRGYVRLKCMVDSRFDTRAPSPSSRRLSKKSLTGKSGGCWGSEATCFSMMLMGHACLIQQSRSQEELGWSQGESRCSWRSCQGKVSSAHDMVHATSSTALLQSWLQGMHTYSCCHPGPIH